MNILEKNAEETEILFLFLFRFIFCVFAFFSS